MTAIRFYTDEHVSKAVIHGLRQRGMDVLTVVEANKLSAPDEEHLAFAFAEGRVILTQDDDFLRLASMGIPHAGIVYTPQHTPLRQIIQGLSLIHQVLEAEDMRRHVEFL